MRGAAARARGFTLVELTIALVLMAAIAALLYGSLSLAMRTWDGGEAKMQQVSDMRTTQTYLRAQIAAQYPQRLWKMTGLPLLFGGERDQIRYAAVLPSRVAEGGVYYFRVAVVRNGAQSQLVQERVVPDVNALQEPEFTDTQRSVLAEGIAELRISYFGRDPDVADTEAPTWRERWDDKQHLPLLIRIDVKPEKGAAWPTLVVEPRRAPEAGCPVWDQGSSRCLRGGGR
jgi:general secretion pathway protein J